MGTTKQLTIGMAAALVLLSSALLTIGLLWLKQQMSQDTPPTKNTLNFLTPDTLARITLPAKALQPTPVLVMQESNASSENTVEFARGSDSKQ